jgi:hypothetical protein
LAEIRVQGVGRDWGLRRLLILGFRAFAEIRVQGVGRD